jgi:hypothetical protein
MVEMVVVLIAVVVVAALAALVFVRLRPRGGDLDSVRSYHSALGTLEHLADRTGPSPVRVIGDAERPGETTPHQRVDPGPPASRQVPPVPVRGSDHFPDLAEPIVFDDARHADRPRAQAQLDGVGPVRLDRAQRYALESMNHRPRRVTTVLISVVVLALFAGLAYAGSKHSKPSRRSAAPATPTTSAIHPTGSTAPTVASHAIGPGGTGAHHHKKAATTTTTAPSRIVAVSTTGASAPFPVGSDSYRLALTASGPCWVLARSAATGSTVWTGTVLAGATQVIPATGEVTLELGAPGVSLTVNRVPVVFPTPMHTPFEATFQPITSATAAGGSSTTSGAPATSTTTTASTGTTGSSGFSG